MVLLKRNGFIGLSLGVFLLWNCSTAYGALILRALPENGGTTLRFGRADKNFAINREVRIRITATDNQQYQVYQRMVDPLRNERGGSLSDSAFQTYVLRGSNASGTLYAQRPERLTFSDQLLYTSSGAGLSDNLTVVYTIDPNNINTSGNFFGRIAYTVRPIGSGSQQTVYLDVTLEASGNLNFKILGSQGSDRIVLSQGKNASQNGYAHIQFDGNLGQDIRIYQEVSRFPQNIQAQELIKNFLQFSASGRTQGELDYQTLTDLSRKRVLLYQSSSQEDEFYVNYQLNSKLIDQQIAGVYNGQITYIVETAGIEKRYDLDLEIKIEPVFFIEVELPSDGMAFNNLLPESPPITKEVRVSVTSNLGKPYMVMQNVVSPLTNQKGEAIANQYFTLKGQLLSNSHGKLSFDDFHEIRTGDGPIFTSGPRGESAEFKMFYRLRSFAEIKAGNYNTSIRYSLEEL